MKRRALRYLLDAGWVIRHLRGHARYRTWFEKIDNRTLAVSIVAVAELFEGVMRADDPNAADAMLREFLEPIEVLDIDIETCRIFGRLSTDVRSAGWHPGDFDVLIAATALQHRLKLLTTNSKHFSRFEGLTVISKP